MPKCLAKEKQPKILPRYCSEVTWHVNWCPLQCLEDLWRPGKTYQILCRPIIEQWYTSSSTRCLSNGIKMGWKWDKLVIKYFKCSDIRVYWVYWKSVQNLMWTEGVTGCNRLTCRFVQRSWMVLVSSGVILPIPLQSCRLCEETETHRAEWGHGNGVENAKQNEWNLSNMLGICCDMSWPKTFAKR